MKKFIIIFSTRYRSLSYLYMEGSDMYEYEWN